MSLQARLILAALLILSVFLGTTGYALQRAFETSMTTSLQERLQSHIYALLSVAESQDNKLVLPDELPVAGLGLTDSGLYATVMTTDMQSTWQSRSLLGQSIIFSAQPPQGQWQFSRQLSTNGADLLVASFTVAWENGDSVTPYIFHMAENLQRHTTTLDEFQRQLWWGMGSAAVLLLIAQLLLLRWGLLPLKHVEQELDAIEAGQQNRIEKTYPAELSSLTTNLNRLIENADIRLRRYRESLGNLAHSLKTPVSVLTGIIENRQFDAMHQDTASEQLTRIAQTVDYHLQRAGAAGRSVLTRPVDIKQLVEKTARALGKVYADKNVITELLIEDDVQFHGDEGDLMEIIGNLSDNAFKWCQSRVRIIVRKLPQNATQHPVEILIEDDGPGIPENISSYVTERGRRADTSVPGQGIGLAMVNEIVRLYGGELSIGSIQPHGTQIKIRL